MKIEKIEFVGKTILEKDSLAMEGMECYCKDQLLLNIEVAHLETPLINITTGLIAPNDVNVHRCRQVGEKVLEKIAGKRPTECKFKKIDYARRIPSKATLQKQDHPAIKSNQIKIMT